jgi:hypothetical protein
VGDVVEGGGVGLISRCMSAHTLCEVTALTQKLGKLVNLWKSLCS